MKNSLYDPTTKRARNFVFLVILAVVLPSLVLAGFGLIAVDNERDAAMIRAKSVYSGVAKGVAKEFNGKIDGLLEHSKSPLEDLESFAKGESSAPGDHFKEFFAGAPFAANYFVISKEGSKELPIESDSKTQGAPEQINELLETYSERVQKIKELSSSDLAELPAMAEALALDLSSPEVNLPAGKVESLAAEAAEALEKHRGNPQTAMAADRLMATASRMKVFAAAAQLVGEVGDVPVLRSVAIDGHRRVVLVKGPDAISGFELVPSAFNPALNKSLEDFGAQKDVRVNVLPIESKSCEAYKERLVSEVMLKKTELAWRMDLYFVSLEAFERLAAGRSRLYLWTLILIAFVLAVGIGKTVKMVLEEGRLSRLKTDFVSNVSHELRTPLTSIRMFTETLLLGRVSSKEEEREFLETIGQETERLSRLTERVLDFARMEADRRPYSLRPESIRRLIDSSVAACRPICRDNGFDLRVEAADDLPKVPVDRDAMIEVLINLLSNAIKYSPEDRSVVIRAQKKGEWMELKVVDKGLGIPKSEQKRIFEKFYRVETPLASEVSGSGLGLSLVKYIVTAHNGEISVDSTPGKGSTFTVRLPLVQK